MFAYGTGISYLSPVVGENNEVKCQREIFADIRNTGFGSFFLLLFFIGGTTVNFNMLLKCAT